MNSDNEVSFTHTTPSTLSINEYLLKNNSEIVDGIKYDTANSFKILLLIHASLKKVCNGPIDGCDTANLGAGGTFVPIN